MRMLTVILCAFFLQACSHVSIHAPLPVAKNVDLNRFMGDWYVIANIPTFIEVGAHNAIEKYVQNRDGTISTTFQFNQDAFDGELKVYEPTGFVSKDNNSIWGMQFIWPFKAEYVIAYLSEDYQHTIIARSKRDYVWVMSRSPVIDDSTYKELIQLCIDMGYEIANIQQVPQQFQQIINRAEVTE